MPGHLSGGLLLPLSGPTGGDDIHAHDGWKVADRDRDFPSCETAPLDNASYPLLVVEGPPSDSLFFCFGLFLVVFIFLVSCWLLLASRLSKVSVIYCSLDAFGRGHQDGVG